MHRHHREAEDRSRTRTLTLTWNRRRLELTGSEQGAEPLTHTHYVTKSVRQL
jgi:hypothetical protein